MKNFSLLIIASGLIAVICGVAEIVKPAGMISFVGAISLLSFYSISMIDLFIRSKK